MVGGAGNTENCAGTSQQGHPGTGQPRSCLGKRAIQGWLQIQTLPGSSMRPSLRLALLTRRLCVCVQELGQDPEGWGGVLTEQHTVLRGKQRDMHQQLTLRRKQKLRASETGLVSQPLSCLLMDKQEEEWGGALMAPPDRSYLSYLF